MCGDKNTNHLIFHHLNPEEKEKLVSQFYILEKIEKEFSKCEILCANCHDKVHYGSSKYKIASKAQQFARDYKHDAGCSVCGEKTECCLQYHHINSDEKYKGISKIYNMEEMKIEMSKCIVLCNNCHKDYHKVGVVI